jgi:RimJ/RimL family protein N-acetyltransferase
MRTRTINRSERPRNWRAREGLISIVRGSGHIETSRLRFRPPRPDDAVAIFSRYASDTEVVRYLGWPRHATVADTRAFLGFSDAEWQRWPAGPFLIELADTGELIGGTGLAFEDASTASTGYVLARDAWRHGYATEALGAMVDLARSLGVRRLYALCHPAHAASIHVLEKGGFHREGVAPGRCGFPNLSADQLTDPVSFVRMWP